MFDSSRLSFIMVGFRSTLRRKNHESQSMYKLEENQYMILFCLSTEHCSSYIDMFRYSSINLRMHPTGLITLDLNEYVKHGDTPKFIQRVSYLTKFPSNYTSVFILLFYLSMKNIKFEMWIKYFSKSSSNCTSAFISFPLSIHDFLK